MAHEIFLDTEGSWKNPVEIGAIVSKDRKIVDSFHRLIYQHEASVIDLWRAKHVHGIPWNSPKHSWNLIAYKEFREFMEKYEQATIYTNNWNIVNFLPERIKNNRVLRLPGWKDRHNSDYHKLAIAAKMGKIPIPGVKEVCTYENHKFYMPYYRSYVHKEEELYAEIYGHCCAQIDAFELWCFKEKIKMEEHLKVLFK